MALASIFDGSVTASAFDCGFFAIFSDCDWPSFDAPNITKTKSSYFPRNNVFKKLTHLFISQSYKQYLEKYLLSVLLDCGIVWAALLFEFNVPGSNASAFDCGVLAAFDCDRYH